MTYEENYYDHMMINGNTIDNVEPITMIKEWTEIQKYE